MTTSSTTPGTTGRFDIGQAITWFFKRFGDNPGGAMWIIFWQILLAAGLAALSVLFLGEFYASLFQLIALEETGRLSDAEAANLIFNSLGPVFTLIPLATLGGILFALAFWGAWLRFLTKGEVKPVIPVRIGGDELRLAGVAILYWVVMFAGYMAGATLFAIIASIIGVSMAGGLDGGGAAAGAGVLFLLGFLGFGAAAIYIVVKLSPAPALNVIDGRFRFFEAWDATKNRFWPLFFSYLIAWIAIILVGGIFGTVLNVALLGAIWPVISEMMSMASTGAEPSAEDVLNMFRDAFMQPGAIIGVGTGLIVLYFGQIVMEGVIHGVGAYAAKVHRDAGGETSDVEKLGADHPAGASPSEG